MMPEPSGADSRDVGAVSAGALRAGQRDEMRGGNLTATRYGVDSRERMPATSRSSPKANRRSKSRSRMASTAPAACG
ncbi:hypothetical protein COEX109129_03650 [Corallococcus exiguus]